MRRESKLLANALLEHHRKTTSAKPPGKRIIAASYTLPYGRLGVMAGVPHVLPVISQFLREVAEWSAVSGYPALNALAVNAETGIPGEGYDGAGGFEIIHWPAELDRCVRFRGYPEAAP
jgi:hypothetical protein